MGARDRAGATTGHGSSIVVPSCAAGLLAARGVPLLSACQTRTHDYGELRIPTPENPIRWPLSKKYPIIESGLKPEPGSVLRIYNYADYLSPRMMKDFEAK